MSLQIRRASYLLKSKLKREIDTTDEYPEDPRLVAVLSAELLKVQAGTEVELPPIYEFISAWTLIESPDTKEYSGELRGLGAVYNGKHDDLSKS